MDISPSHKIDSEMTARILIVDDERNIRRSLSALLGKCYRVKAVGSGEEALLSIEEQPYDLIILDIQLPAMSGIEVLERVREEHPEMAIIMLTGHASTDSAISALRFGATNYLRKPATSEQLFQSVKEALQDAYLKKQHSAMLVKAKSLFQTALDHLVEIVPEPEEAILETLPEEESEEDPERFMRQGPLLIDLYRRQASLRGKSLDLTAGEYDLLLCLVEKAPKVVDPQTIVKITRGFECNLFEARDLIRWQVYLLRQKVEEDPSSPEFIINVRGKGYMWAGV